MTFEVRPPVVDEADSIAQLHVQSWRETYSHLLPTGFFDGEHPEGRRRMWARILGDGRPDWTVRVAEGPRGLVGFAMSGPAVPEEGEAAPRDRQLYTLYAAQAVHGTGVGQSLLDAVLGEAPAMLWVAAQNPRAIAFYRRNGFTLDGVEKVDPAAPRITDARMIR